MIEEDDFFGSAVSLLGDLNDDGILEWAIGASGTADSAGAVYIISQPRFAYASVSVHEGSGTNQATLRALRRPLLGETWIATVESPIPGAFLSGVFWSNGPAPALGTMIPSGELLCDPPYINVSMGVDKHLFPIPADLALVGRVRCAQGIAFQNGSKQLTNALEVRIGDM